MDRKAYLGFTLCACLIVAGCGDSAPKTWSRDEIADIAGDTYDDTALLAKLQDMETRVAELERKAAFQEAYAEAISKDLDSVSGQVSRNAKVANDNALRDMTNAGACGRERVDYPDGSWTLRNRECTLKDMRKD